MIEIIRTHFPERLKEIRIKTDDNVKSQEFCAYRIEIETNRRMIVLEGCHDMTPELKSE